MPPLIQRLGRLNRDAGNNSPTRPLLVITEETKAFPLDTHLPYTATDLDAARGWLNRLPAADISQRILSAVWEDFDTTRQPEFVSSAWLDGGPSTVVLELRKASPGITVLMEEDLPAVGAGKKVARVALPMPQVPAHLNWHNWREVRGIRVAPKGTVIYSQSRGAEWQRGS